MGRRIEVSRSVEREVYLHNVLGDLLIGINRRFDDLVTPEAKQGWKSEAVNGIIILAMLNEGWIDAVARKTLEGWKPRAGAEEKLHKICNKYLPDLQFNKSPLSSVDEVRKIRNEFAHAKPLIETRQNELAVLDESDHQAAFKELHHPIESQITIENYRRFRNDSKEFRNLLLEKSGLQYWDLKTRVHEVSKFIREMK
jgi:hypothetical protein